MKRSKYTAAAEGVRRRTTLPVATGTTRVNSLVPPSTVYALGFAALWLSEASDKGGDALPLEVPLTAALRRAVAFYVDHLGTLETTEAKTAEFEAVERMAFVSAPSLKEQDRIEGTLNGAREGTAELPQLFRDLMTGTTQAERTAQRAALDDRVESHLPKKYRDQSTPAAEAPAPIDPERGAEVFASLGLQPMHPPRWHKAPSKAPSKATASPKEAAK